MAFPQNKQFDRQYGSYLAGESKRSIGLRLGISGRSVCKAFDRRGFKKRTRWLVNEETRELIRILAATGDHTRQTIANAFGYKSYVSVSGIVNYKHEQVNL